MDYTIQRAAGTDAAEMLAYLAQIGGETDNLTFGREGLPIDLERETRYLEESKDNPYNAIFMARKNGKIVGDASFSGSPRPRLRHRGELGICVLKEEWGRGIGSALMRAVIDHARREAGAELIVLEVRCDNTRAIGLYEKLGFVKTGTLPGMLKIDGKLIDFYTMTLKL